MEISLKAEELFKIGSFGVTNGLFLTFVVSLILISLAILIRKKINIVPGKLQGAVEIGVEWFLDLMHSTLGSLEQAERYFSLIFTIFIFIMVSNLLGIFPGVGSLHIFNVENNVPVFRSPAADLNFTRRSHRQLQVTGSMYRCALDDAFRQRQRVLVREQPTAQVRAGRTCARVFRHATSLKSEEIA